MVDEITKVNKQNSEYRGLILKNEQVSQEMQQELMDHQKQNTIQKRTINTLKQEIEQLNKQVQKLIEELKDKSDSESFDDEKERLNNIKKAMKAEQLQAENNLLQNEIDTLKAESESNISKIQNQLKFSRDANINLKNDYDLLQEK